MKEHQQDTIQFIPERLNKRPAVYRGMTLSELFIVILIGVGIGIVIGIILMLFLNDFVWIPTAIVPTAIIAVRFGGFYLSRMKRGKPDNWLERFIELKRSPSKFITSSTDWSIKRTRITKKVKRK
ncbi:MAG: TIGR03750 family conjugal transfer protein [Pasteurella oralis]|uniref:TIGR03750 family conjugal transfer protein n=1 Tax=Pasteurella oralis TaxID=1071947 RepID=UPI00271011DC|nr:TIGR03750 family conjugal transfer protein [Pasteurella oralis]